MTRRLLVQRELILILSCLLWATACSGSKVTTQVSNELPRYQVRTMALLPFTSLTTPQVRDHGDPYLSTPRGAKGSDISLGVPSSAEPSLRQTVTVPAYAAEKVTQLFWNRLRHRQGITVTAASQGGKPSLSGIGENQPTPETVAAAAAKALKVDAAVLGQVLVYQERIGSRLGASPPASVGFEVKVVAPDGQVLWVGNFYERQQPMTQDFIGFVRHGGVFITVEELAQYGVDEILKEFPFGQPGDS